MGSGKGGTSSAQQMESSIEDMRERHRLELENLTLTTQPFKTLKLFILAILQYFTRSVSYLLAKGGWLMLSSTLIAVLGIFLVTVEGPHEKHVEEVSEYVRFGLWWIALGVASSIGLGSGLHTFVLYLGPHIALFTIKAMQCGRIDLKSAPYDTIQLKRSPSWLDKPCGEFGPPLFSSSHGSRVPISSILPQVQMEAILWGLGTALGELPPYFISRAASVSGSRIDALEELDPSSSEDNGVIATRLRQIEHWLLSHSQHMNFFTILVLASIPNPLFDLAGIMCGQFGIPFWKFFLATLIGKAIIKTHIQTVFIISVCNNQLLDWIENELIWVLSLIPGFGSFLPTLTSKLHSVKEKYMAAPPPVPSNIKEKWDFSFTSIWNTIVWLMLMNFFIKIVNATARRILLLLLLLAAIIYACFNLPMEAILQDFLFWVDSDLGPWGPLVLAIAYIPLTILAVPASVLTLGGGYLFGFLVGFISDSIGAILGAGAAFLLGKTIGRSLVFSKLKDYPQFQLIAIAIQRSGFKIVLLLRLAPLVPFSVLNYLLSVTPISFGEYILASWLGMVPLTVALVYAGTTLKDLSDVTHGLNQFSTGRWAFLVVSLVVSVALMICVTKVAKTALDQALAENEDIDSIIRGSLPELPVFGEEPPDLHQPFIRKTNPDDSSTRGE
ncbi:hypothetical protein V6N11_065622 [Hibiscus sabdariffa]|uniref:VTT domain-containing protein n=1 Tax=Hibiscus sabdariffa TaxID=183260 RepID=A0ABR2PI89_9ROSI